MGKSKDIKLSRKHGLNPTIPVCFWCGNEKNEIALMGEVFDSNGQEIEMPTYACINYEPCEECKKQMELGFTIMEATSQPNENTNVEFQSGVYPTGKWAVLKPDAAARIFNNVQTDKAFVEPEVWKMIMGD